jgi:O-succinylbenzoic acid--CoA ligase
VHHGFTIEKAIGDFILDWFDEKSYITLQTSGTTGDPKTIQMAKQKMVNSALATGDFFDLKPGDTALLCLPVDFIAGKMMLVRSFILGLEIDLVEPTSNPLERAEKVYDFVAMVPLQVEKAIDKLQYVKKLIVGGAKMSTELARKVTDLAETAVYETYGMTETVTHIAAKKVGVAAFSLLPQVTISQNETNCLVIHAPRISEEAIVTNDVVEIINDNQFLFLGRADNVVNSGGIKLIPEQIEHEISKVISCPFFVGGIADATLGEKLVLVVEGEKGIIDEKVLDHLDKYKKPKAIFYTDHFATTTTGKLKRKEILESLISI